MYVLQCGSLCEPVDHWMNNPACHDERMAADQQNTTYTRIQFQTKLHQH
jgi:hypothetical protein